MGHITRYGIKIDTSDFRKFWHGTVAYNRDGCSSIYIIPFHKGKCTDSVIKRFFKQANDTGIYLCCSGGWRNEYSNPQTGFRLAGERVCFFTVQGLSSKDPRLLHCSFRTYRNRRLRLS